MDPLTSLFAASIAFVGTHFAMSHPLRSPLVARIGENGFRGLYSLVALGTFVWAILAFRSIGPGGEPLWDGLGDVTWAVVSAIMLIASVLLAGSFVGNPALPDPRAARHAEAGPHGVFHVTRHPMMWAMALWAATHILLSPTPRQLALAGAVGVLALVGAHLQDRKKQELMGAAWSEWQAKTSYWPRLGSLPKAGATAWIGGFILWALLTYAHIHANGVPAGIFRWL